MKTTLFRFAVLATLFGFLIGCVTPFHDYHHGSFNQESIEKGGVAVIGVVADYQKMPSSRYLSWAKRLESSVQRHRRYPIVTAKSVNQKLGDNYEFILDAFQETNRLGATELKLIQKAGVKAKYGLIARIKKNDQSELPKQSFGVRDVDGYVFRDRSRVILQTERVVVVSAQVIDLTTGHLVWQSTREVAPKESAEFISYKGKSFTTALTIATLNTLSNGTHRTRQPRAPTFDSTLALVLNELADQLPIQTRR